MNRLIELLYNNGIFMEIIPDKYMGGVRFIFQKNLIRKSVFISDILIQSTEMAIEDRLIYAVETFINELYKIGEM